MAIDSYLANPQSFTTEASWMQTLGALSEGSQTTLGAYNREWQ